MKHLLFTIAITLFLAGCAAGTLSGRLVTQSGKPVIGAEIKLWKNQFYFMSLPENVARTTTDEDGSFEVHMKERVSFVTFDSPTCSGVINRVSELKKQGFSVSFNQCM